MDITTKIQNTNNMKIREVIFREQATAGATSAGNIASVVSPQIAIGPAYFAIKTY